MMLSKKNSETLENFSEKLEVEGRSLWQDARRRFMHNRAAVASLIVLVLIALFVILAPMLSQFAYDDTDWAMMSSARIWSPVTTLVLTHPVATCLCALRLAGVSHSWSVLLRHWWQWSSGHFMVRFPVIWAVRWIR